MGQETESEEGAVDAAQAFEALQAEVALQRQAIEALGEALGEALDGVLEGRTPLELSPDIARILQGQVQVAQQVDLLRQHPALKLTPVQYGEALGQAGGAVVREAAQQLKNATQEVERERAQLRELVGSVHGNRRHRRQLWWVAGAALAAGLVLSLAGALAARGLEQPGGGVSGQAGPLGGRRAADGAGASVAVAWYGRGNAPGEGQRGSVGKLSQPSGQNQARAALRDCGASTVGLLEWNALHREVNQERRQPAQAWGSNSRGEIVSRHYVNLVGWSAVNKTILC